VARTGCELLRVRSAARGYTRGRRRGACSRRWLPTPNDSGAGGQGGGLKIVYRGKGKPRKVLRAKLRTFTGSRYASRLSSGAAVIADHDLASAGDREPLARADKLDNAPRPLYRPES
jgi:hypothetical protein